MTICPRCAKQTADIHTCTPTPLARELEPEVERLWAAVDQWKASTRRAIKLDGELAAKNKRLRALLAEARVDVADVLHEMLRRDPHLAPSTVQAQRILLANIDAALAAKETG